MAAITCPVGHVLYDPSPNTPGTKPRETIVIRWMDEVYEFCTACFIRSLVQMVTPLPDRVRTALQVQAPNMLKPTSFTTGPPPVTQPKPTFNNTPGLAIPMLDTLKSIVLDKPPWAPNQDDVEVYWTFEPEDHPQPRAHIRLVEKD